MFEKHHYKGRFEFFFHPTNQTKLAKSLLPEIFPEAAVKQARGKKLEQHDREQVTALALKLLNKLRSFRPFLLQLHFLDLFEKSPEEVVLSYLILKRVAEDVSFKANFDVKLDLALTVLVEALHGQLGE